MKKTLILTLIMGLMGHAMAADETTSKTTDTTASGSEVRHAKTGGGFYLEPMLIYSRNDATVKPNQLPLAGDQTGTMNDAAIGARLGMHVNETVFVAADGRYGRSHFQDSLYQAADATTYNYGVTVGAQTPVAGIQLWGTYILGGVFDPAAGAQNVDMKFNDARGYRVGAGVHVLAVSLNLEYQDLVYKNSTIESFGNLAVNNNASVDGSQIGYAVSVGFPVEF